MDNVDPFTEVSLTLAGGIVERINCPMLKCGGSAIPFHAKRANSKGPRQGGAGGGRLQPGARLHLRNGVRLVRGEIARVHARIHTCGRILFHVVSRCSSSIVEIPSIPCCGKFQLKGRVQVGTKYLYFSSNNTELSSEFKKRILKKQN